MLQVSPSVSQLMDLASCEGYQMRDNRIKELRDAGIVTAKHVDTKLNLADRLTKGLSHVARQALDREMDEIRKRLISRAGAI